MIINDRYETTFSIPGQKWHQRRKLLTQAFHFNILKKYFVIFTERTDFFLAKVQEEVGKEKTDLVPLISATTLRIMCGL